MIFGCAVTRVGRFRKVNAHPACHHLIVISKCFKQCFPAFIFSKVYILDPLSRDMFIVFKELVVELVKPECSCLKCIDFSGICLITPDTIRGGVPTVSVDRSFDDISARSPLTVTLLL